MAELLLRLARPNDHAFLHCAKALVSEAPRGHRGGRDDEERLRSAAITAGRWPESLKHVLQKEDAAKKNAPPRRALPRATTAHSLHPSTLSVTRSCRRSA